jgi:hypothetical protein
VSERDWKRRANAPHLIFQGRYPYGLYGSVNRCYGASSGAPCHGVVEVVGNWEQGFVRVCWGHFRGALGHDTDFTPGLQIGRRCCESLRVESQLERVVALEEKRTV